VGKQAGVEPDFQTLPKSARIGKLLARQAREGTLPANTVKGIFGSLAWCYGPLNN